MTYDYGRGDRRDQEQGRNPGRGSGSPGQSQDRSERGRGGYGGHEIAQEQEGGTSRAGFGEHDFESRGSSGQGARGSRETARGGYGGTMAGATRGQFSGRGPKGYRRSDERIREDVSEELTRHPEVDASEIEVRVENGEVTLAGMVEDRHQKRLAEDLAERISGVSDVHNQLRVHKGLGQQIKGTFTGGEGRETRSGTRGAAGTS